MPVLDTRPKSLAAVIDAIAAKEDLPAVAKTELTSAVRTFSRCVGRAPAEIDANPVAIRALARYAKPELAGVSHGHFKNTLSRLKRALTEVGIAVDRRRNMPLDPAWQTLLAPLPEMKRVELRKFAGWCSARGIAPKAVGRQSFADYFAFLSEQSIQHNIKERWRRPWRVWNEAVAVEGSGHPRVDSIFDDKDRLISLAELPPQFGSELKAYQEVLTRPALFGGAAPPAASGGGLAERLTRGRRKPLRPNTAEGYARNLVALVGYLVRDGMPPEYFSSLDKLVDPDLMMRGLLRIQTDILADRERRRCGPADPMTAPPSGDPNEPVPMVTAVAYSVLSLAKYAKADPPTLRAIDELAAKTRVLRRGMTAKNKARLNQLSDPRAKKLLLNLPTEVFSRYDGVKTATFKAAREVQNAAVLAVLLELPLRVANVAYLDLDKHIHRPVHGSGKWIVSIPAGEVKNDVDIDSEFSEATSELLARYLTLFRPAIGEKLTSALFPSRTGEAKHETTISTQFKEFIRRETGFVLNVHLMRHVAATNWLDAYPEDAETARQLLAHKSVDTTRKFYAVIDKRRAFRRYQEVLDEIRRAPTEVAKPTFEFARRKRGGAQ